ncbi:hypothetical protein ACFFSY_20295 [Paenibacillus aurantiacus]|uniref:RRM domain-containing protein n=1 Tax=Paenibacillus aurantiacus TaxID=1936118 RepID=A0ABV5KST3_9BACL
MAEPEDRLPYPLPCVAMVLENMHEVDVPATEDEMDRAFAAFGSAYVCRLMDIPLFPNGGIHKKCSHCEEVMHYVATVCSEDYDIEGLIQEGFSFIFGEAFLYFFICRSCCTIETEMQST